MSMLGDASRINNKSMRRRKQEEGLCLCGRPLAIFEPLVPFVLIGKEATVRYGRPASACRQCLDKNKGENIMENLETSVKLNDFVSGIGPDELTIAVNNNTQQALEELLRMMSYRSGHADPRP